MTQTATSRNIAIEGMSGDECVNKVRGALKHVPNVSTQSVKVGSATIEADQAGCAAACKAVESAGFRTKESGSQHGSHQGADRGSQQKNDGGSRPSGGSDQPRRDAGDKSSTMHQHHSERAESTPAHKGDSVKQEGDRPTAAQRG